MKRKIILLVTAATVALFGAYFIYRQQTESPTQSCRLVVGTAAGYAPFVSINEQGAYEGFDIDVATALAQEMNCTLEIKDLGSMTALFMALEQGKIDVIIWALSITQDRLNKVAMVHYQGDDVTAYPLIFWGEIPANINSIQDMIGKTVCVEPTSAQDAALSRYDFITKVPTERVDDALLNLQFGKVAAAFVEPAIAIKFQKKYPEIKILNVNLPEEDCVKGIGIAIKKNKTNMIERVSQAVQQLKEQGAIKKFEEKWNIQ